MNGVIIADKPEGWTSHDVVAAVKKKLGAKKVGHLGTLDPIATGVLTLVVNGATKYADRLDTGEKEYLTTLKLGEETDSYDRAGKVVSSAPVDGITEQVLLAAFAPFRGRIRQVPPMYSAIKSKGTPLYKLARKGVVVEREPREVEIYSLEVTRIEFPFVEFRTVCSRGTYVRSICHDLGKALGCGAHLYSLRRLRCGRFTIEAAVDPKGTPEGLNSAIIPLEDALRMASGEGAASRAS